MTAVTARPNPCHSPTGTPEGSQPAPTRRLQRPLWNRFTPLQLLVMALATVSPLTIVFVISAALVGVMTDETMREVALAAGEDPGMITFGAMFLVSPVQWLTGRSQVRVRKYLGIVFFGLAFSNGAMFVFEEGLGSIFSEPLLIAGTIAVALATPLFLTSSRWSQRKMGMKNWRLLHRLTYPVALALLAHVIFIGDLGPGAVLITIGFIARVPAIRRRLTASSGRIRLAR